jgi:hypothetical protein
MNLDDYLLDLNDLQIRQWLVKIDYWELSKIWYLINDYSKEKIIKNVSDRLKDSIYEKSEEYNKEKISLLDISNTFENLLINKEELIPKILNFKGFGNLRRSIKRNNIEPTLTFVNKIDLIYKQIGIIKDIKMLSCSINSPILKKLLFGILKY